MKESFYSITGEVIQTQTLYGGDINNVTLLKCEKGNFVLKKNKNAIENMFFCESSGLQTLYEAGLRVPQVFDYTQEHILLQYYEPGPKDEVSAGRELAALHSHKSDTFGLAKDNFIGSLIQPNGPNSSWSDFFWHERLAPLLEKLEKIDGSEINHPLWLRLSEKLETLFSKESASLIHGDLWSGNLYYSKDGPLFIDPAVYYANRAIELSFTKLFGGFSSVFYNAYLEVSDFPDDFPELQELYNIYPLLVHAVLFGGHYYRQAEQNAKKYV